MLHKIEGDAGNGRYGYAWTDHFTDPKAELKAIRRALARPWRAVTKASHSGAGGFATINAHPLSLRARMTTIMEQVAARLSAAPPDDPSRQLLQKLIAALDQPAENFDIKTLYVLNADDFELALALIADWRFRRHLHGTDGGLHAALARISTPRRQGQAEAGRVKTVH